MRGSWGSGLHRLRAWLLEAFVSSALILPLGGVHAEDDRSCVPAARSPLWRVDRSGFGPDVVRDQSRLKWAS